MEVDDEGSRVLTHLRRFNASSNFYKEGRESSRFISVCSHSLRMVGMVFHFDYACCEGFPCHSC